MQSLFGGFETSLVIKMRELINVRALESNETFETALPALDAVLNDPWPREKNSYFNAQTLQKEVSGFDALLAAPPEQIGRAIAIVLQCFKLLESKRDLRHFYRLLETTLTVLRGRPFILIPADAKYLFGPCLSIVHSKKLFARLVTAAIEGGVEGDEEHLSVLQQIASIDHVKALSEFSFTKPNFTENLDASMKALALLGGQKDQHPNVVALRAAQKAETALNQRINEFAHPLVANLMTANHGDGAATQQLFKDVEAAVKSLDRAGRSELFEGILQAAEFFWQETYFDTALGKHCTTLACLSDYPGRWQMLVRIADKLSKKPIDVEGPRALWLFDRFDRSVIVIERPEGQYYAVGRLRLGISIPLLRAIAAKLPKSSTFEDRVRLLELPTKQKTILLDAVSTVERGDPAALRLEVVKRLDLARQEYSAVPRSARVPQREKRGLLSRFLFPKKSVSLHSTITQRRNTNTAKQVTRQLADAVMSGLHWGLDVEGDIDALQKDLMGTILRAEDKVGPLASLADVEATLHKVGLQDPATNLLISAREAFEILGHVQVLQNLSPETRQVTQSLIAALTPAPEGQHTTGDWNEAAAQFVGSDAVEMALGQVLSDFVPPVGSAEQSHGSTWLHQGSAFKNEAQTLTALIRLVGRGYPSLSGALENIAILAFEDIKGIGPRSPRFGNCALWALADLPGGAGAEALKRVARATTFPSHRERAIELIKSMAGGPGGDVASLAVDHGLASGMREETLALGAGILRPVLPDRIEVTWRREDGKVGKVPTSAMKEADPAGIKRIKKLVKTIESDLAAQGAALEQLYFGEATFALEDWQAQYLDHGTLGPLVRALIWTTEAGQSVLPVDDGFQDASGAPVEAPASLTLWHPLGKPDEEINAWRQALMTQRITQPFPQAWRDCYTLEEGSETDRFSRYVVKQEAFRKSMLSKGWTGKVAKPNAPETFLCLHFPERDIAIVLDLAIPDGAPDHALQLQLGALRFCKLSHGAKPTATNLKKAKPVDAADLPDWQLSEICRHIAEAVDLSHTKLAEYTRDSGLALVEMRMAVLDAIIAHHGVEHVTRDGAVLTVMGEVETYKVHVNKGHVTDLNNLVVYLRVKPTSLVPGVPMPHGRDPAVFRVMAQVDKLLDDKRLVGKGYGSNSIQLPRKKSA